MTHGRFAGVLADGTDGELCRGLVRTRSRGFTAAAQVPSDGWRGRWVTGTLVQTVVVPTPTKEQRALRAPVYCSACVDPVWRQRPPAASRAGVLDTSTRTIPLACQSSRLPSMSEALNHCREFCPLQTLPTADSRHRPVGVASPACTCSASASPTTGRTEGFDKNDLPRKGLCPIDVPAYHDKVSRLTIHGDMPSRSVAQSQRVVRPAGFEPTTIAFGGCTSTCISCNYNLV